MESRSPDVRETIDRLRRSIYADLHVAIPARVERYDAQHRCVDVVPLVKDPRPDAEAVSFGVLTRVPVVFPGAGGFRLTFPIAAGDTVLLVFADRSLDIWKSRGVEVDPVAPWRHALADAIAIPGLESIDGATAADSTDTVLKGPGDAELRVTTGTPAPGGVQGAALGGSLETFLGLLKTWLEAHVHSSAMGPTGPPVVLPSPTVPALESGTVKVSR